MDILEQAFEEEQGRKGALVELAHAKKDPQRLEPTGYCLNCFEDVTDGHLFCDGACADAYTARMKLKSAA